jgi:hypothetical protein
MPVGCSASPSMSGDSDTEVGAQSRCRYPGNLGLMRRRGRVKGKGFSTAARKDRRWQAMMSTSKAGSEVRRGLRGRRRRSFRRSRPPERMAGMMSGDHRSCTRSSIQTAEPMSGSDSAPRRASEQKHRKLMLSAAAVYDGCGNERTLDIEGNLGQYIAYRCTVSTRASGSGPEA